MANTRLEHFDMEIDELVLPTATMRSLLDGLDVAAWQLRKPQLATHRKTPPGRVQRLIGMTTDSRSSQ